MNSRRIQLSGVAHVSIETSLPDEHPVIFALLPDLVHISSWQGLSGRLCVCGWGMCVWYVCEGVANVETAKTCIYNHIPSRSPTPLLT